MTQTVATTARTMSTAKPLLPEIAQTMVTSLKATYSYPAWCPIPRAKSRGRALGSTYYAWYRY
jgi:hypothetical protein